MFPAKRRNTDDDGAAPTAKAARTTADSEEKADDHTDHADEYRGQGQHHGRGQHDHDARRVHQDARSAFAGADAAAASPTARMPDPRLSREYGGQGQHHGRGQHDHDARRVHQDARSAFAGADAATASLTARMPDPRLSDEYHNRGDPAQPRTIDGLIAEDEVKAKLREIANCHKARSVMYDQWGFDFREAMRKQKGISVMLCGPMWVDKVDAVNAVVFEIGRPVKFVNCFWLQFKSLAETRESIHEWFDDALRMNAVLVVEGFESFGSHFDPRESPSDVFDLSLLRAELLDLLLRFMEDFPSTTILVTTLAAPTMPSHIFSGFARKIDFIVEVRNVKLRERLWRACVPDKAPLDSTVDFRELADRFEMSRTAIRRAVFCAATSAASRDEASRIITMKDLLTAAEVEHEAPWTRFL